MEDKRKEKEVGYREARNGSSGQTMTFICEIFTVETKSTWGFISTDNISY